MATFTWTVDVESDYGGRSQTTQGIVYGLPRILEVFKQYGINGLFFISTELLGNYPVLPTHLRHLGHEVGSHGHFHVKYKERWRSEEDKRISMKMLDTQYYRAPWFNYETDCIYSQKANHVSVLKQSWFGGKIPNDPIFYIHPFDIVRGDSPPNTFCRVLYSHPDIVWDTFNRICKLYPGKDLSKDN